MPLGGLIPYGAMTQPEMGDGLFALQENAQPTSQMAGLLGTDFNAQARALAGPMAPLPTFPNVQIQGGGPVGGGEASPGGPNTPSQPLPGSAPISASGGTFDRGGDLASFQREQQLRDRAFDPLLDDPGQYFPTVSPFEGGGGTDWGNVALGFGLGGIPGAFAGYSMSPGGSEVPSAVRYAGVPGVSQTDAELDAWMSDPNNMDTNALFEGLNQEFNNNALNALSTGVMGSTPGSYASTSITGPVGGVNNAIDMIRDRTRQR